LKRTSDIKPVKYPASAPYLLDLGHKIYTIAVHPIIENIGQTSSMANMTIGVSGARATKTLANAQTLTTTLVIIPLVRSDTLICKVFQ